MKLPKKQMSGFGGMVSLILFLCQARCHNFSRKITIVHTAESLVLNPWRIILL
jgi:cystathionine beta-lyase/cystathionine gamma-synthase